MFFPRSFLDLFFPLRCVGCGDEGQLLCRACSDALPRYAPCCPACEAPDGMGRVCASCRGHPPWTALDGLWSFTTYHESPVVAKAVHALKYKQWSHLARNLTEALAERFESSVRTFEPDALAAVPLSRDRQRSRGFNQAELIAQRLGETWGVSWVGALKRVRETGQQAHLNRKDRLGNLRAAFEVDVLKEGLVNKKVILVDDVCTTGATLNACAERLKAAGAREVVGLVFARSCRKLAP